MNRATDNQLLEALEALESGTSVAEILSRYPTDVAQELRPVLELTLQLEQRKLQPTSWSRIQSKQKFLAQAQAMKNRPVQNSVVSLWHRLMALTPAFVLSTFLMVFGIGWFSQYALPGDTLYSTKRLLEVGQIWGSNDPADLYVLEAEHNQERIREVYSLLAAQRTEAVIFEGLVESINGNLWTIEGLTVVVSDQTKLDNPPAGVKQLVRVEGQTAIGRVQATAITALTAPIVEPNPVPTPTLAPVVTSTPATATPPSLTATANPTSEVTQTVEATPKATLTATLRPTQTTTRPPTATTTTQPTLFPTATFTPVPTVVILPTTTPLPPNNNENENSNESNSNEGNNNDDDGIGNGNDDDNSGSNNNDDDDNSGSGGSNNNDDDDDSGSGGGGDNDNDD